jgi:hypothetical protein
MPPCADTQEESVQPVMHHCTDVGKPGEPGPTNRVLFLQLQQTYHAAHTRDGRKAKESPFLVVQLNVSLKNEPLLERGPLQGHEAYQLQLLGHTLFDSITWGRMGYSWYQPPVQ